MGTRPEDIESALRGKKTLPSPGEPRQLSKEEPKGQPKKADTDGDHPAEQHGHAREGESGGDAKE